MFVITPLDRLQQMPPTYFQYEPMSDAYESPKADRKHDAEIPLPNPMTHIQRIR